MLPSCPDSFPYQCTLHRIDARPVAHLDSMTSQTRVTSLSDEIPTAPPAALPQRSIAGWVSESTGGYTYLEFIRSLARRVDSEWDAVKADLESIRKALVQRSGALVNLTADDRTLQSTSGAFSELLSALPGAASGAGDAWSPVLERRNEALVVPTQVNYVGKAVNLYKDAGYDVSGAETCDEDLSRCVSQGAPESLVCLKICALTQQCVTNNQ